MKFLKVTISMTRQSDQKTFAGDFFYAVYGDKHKVRLHLSRFGEFLKKGSVFVMTERHLGIKAEEIVEGGKEKFLSFILNMEKENEPELFQVAYVTQVWYDIETFEEEVDGEMGKSTYVHTSTLQNESEILFFEDELLMGQFHSQFMNGRTRRLFQQKPKSDPDLKDRPN